MQSVDNLVQATINNENKIFQKTIDNNISDVLFLKDEVLTELHDHRDSISNKLIAHLSQTFASFSKQRDIYDQIRFVNQHGQEIARINNRNKIVNIVPKQKLQNKKHRYYFAKSILRQNNEIYFSPLDLNVEKKQIERPLRPMIRIGSPIFSKQGKKLGIILLNYNAQELLNRLKQTSHSVPGRLFVINQDGYFILAQNSNQEWGNMLSSRKDMNAKKLFPTMWKKLNGKSSAKIYTKRGIFFVKDITSTLPALQFGDLKLKFVWLVPWQDIIPNAIKYYLVALLLLLIASFFISWIWALLKIKQEEHKKELEFLAKTDPLTRLANRHELFRLGKFEFDRAKRFKKPFSALMFDLDFFKKVNDTYGHLNGDKALVATAHALKSTIRTIDFVARFGGEEFVIILPETSTESAKILAEKLRREIAHIKIPCNGTQYSFTASIGVSTWNEQDANIDSVINRADENLYKAKEGGRNQVVAED